MNIFGRSSNSGAERNSSIRTREGESQIPPRELDVLFRAEGEDLEKTSESDQEERAAAIQRLRRLTYQDSNVSNASKGFPMEQPLVYINGVPQVAETLNTTGAPHNYTMNESGQRTLRRLHKPPVLPIEAPKVARPPTRLSQSDLAAPWPPKASTSQNLTVHDPYTSGGQGRAETSLSVNNEQPNAPRVIGLTKEEEDQFDWLTDEEVKELELQRANTTSIHSNGQTTGTNGTGVTSMGASGQELTVIMTERNYAENAATAQNTREESTQVADSSLQSYVSEVPDDTHEARVNKSLSKAISQLNSMPTFLEIMERSLARQQPSAIYSTAQKGPNSLGNPLRGTSGVRMTRATYVDSTVGHEGTTTGGASQQGTTVKITTEQHKIANVDSCGTSAGHRSQVRFEIHTPSSISVISDDDDEDEVNYTRMSKTFDENTVIQNPVFNRPRTFRSPVAHSTILRPDATLRSTRDEVDDNENDESWQTTQESHNDADTGNQQSHVYESLNVNGGRREPITINEVTSGLKLTTAQIPQINDSNKMHKPIGHQQKETPPPLVQPAFMLSNGLTEGNAATEMQFAPPISISLRPSWVENPATVDGSTQTSSSNQSVNEPGAQHTTQPRLPTKNRNPLTRGEFQSQQRIIPEQLETPVPTPRMPVTSSERNVEQGVATQVNPSKVQLSATQTVTYPRENITVTTYGNSGLNQRSVQVNEQRSNTKLPRIPISEVYGGTAPLRSHITA